MPDSKAAGLLPEKGRAMLVVIDFQEKLAPLTADHAEVETNIRRLVESAAIFSLPALVSEQYVKGLGPTTAAVREAAAGLPSMEKLEFSCWRNEGMRAALRAFGRPHAILCGIETHVCVLQTALDMLAAGLRVFVPEDAVTSRTATNRRVGLRLMERAGASIVSTETIVFSFLEKCGTPEFKAMLARIR